MKQRLTHISSQQHLGEAEKLLQKFLLQLSKTSAVMPQVSSNAPGDPVDGSETSSVPFQGNVVVNRHYPHLAHDVSKGFPRKAI